MPKTTIYGKFEVDPNYDETADLERSIAEARTYLEKEVACIDAIDNTTLQLICLFAMIDCLAQEEANYWGDPKTIFCQFILKHQRQCNYLGNVEPVTLYYHVEDLIDEAVLYPGFPPEKVISLEDLGYLYGETVKHVIETGKAERILDHIKTKKGADFAEKKAKEHQVISLLYRMRSKAVHEMSGLGQSMNFHSELKPKEPYYRDVGRSYVEGENIVSDDVVELVIPNVFIRSILLDCIDGYLAECREKRRFPFSNNHMTRKPNLSWYDR